MTTVDQSTADACQVLSGVGPGNHDRKTIAEALSPAGLTGSTSRKIAAMVQYGFLEKTSKGFSVSSLTRRLARPLPGEEADLKREAFMSVPLFRKVVERYEPEGRLPDVLPRLLERYFDIVAPNGEQVAKILVASARQAGVIDESNEFVTGRQAMEETEPAPEPVQMRQEAPLPTTGSSPVFTAVNGIPGQISIVLPSPFVTISCPAKLTQKEKDRVLRWMEGVVRPWLEFAVEELGEEDES